MSDLPTRRQFIASGAALTGAALAGLVPALAACGGGGPKSSTSCEGYAALKPTDLQQRTALQYVDVTPVGSQLCLNCRLYVQPAGESPCGGCQLFAGPVLPGGWCKSWVAQAAAS